MLRMAIESHQGDKQTDMSVMLQRRSRSCPVSVCGKNHLAQLDGNWVMAVCSEIRWRGKWWMNCIAPKILYTAVMPVSSRSITVVIVSGCLRTIPFSSLPLNSHCTPVAQWCSSTYKKKMKWHKLYFKHDWKSVLFLKGSLSIAVFF